MEEKKRKEQHLTHVDEFPFEYFSGYPTERLRILPVGKSVLGFLWAAPSPQAVVLFQLPTSCNFPDQMCPFAPEAGKMEHLQGRK